MQNGVEQIEQNIIDRTEQQNNNIIKQNRINRIEKNTTGKTEQIEQLK